MSRGLAAATLAAIATRTVRPRFFLELDFAGGFVRMHSGTGPVSFQGETYLGAGNLGRIGPLGESVGVRATGAVFGLSGIPAASIALALGEDYQGRPAKLWLALVDAAEAVIGQAVLVFSGLMDTMPVLLPGATATVQVTAESYLARLTTASNRLLTLGDQQADYPDDLGLGYVESIQDKEFIWGGGRGRAFTPRRSLPRRRGGGGDDPGAGSLADPPGIDV